MLVLPDRIHFIGGCGRAMAGVMVAVANLGVRVTGSDVENTYGSTRHWLAKKRNHNQPRIQFAQP